MDRIISLDQIAISEVENIEAIEELKYHKTIHFNSLIGNYFLTVCITSIFLTFIIIIYRIYKTLFKENLGEFSI